MRSLIPSFADFRSAVSPGEYTPFLKKIDCFQDPFQIYRDFRDPGGLSVLLESARTSSKMGRTSVIAKNPFLILEAKGFDVTLRSYRSLEKIKGDPFQVTQRILKQLASPKALELPPYAGGAVGFVGYEAKNILEPCLSQNAKDDLGLPDVYFLFFDEGIILDHEQQTLYLFANVRVGRDAGQSYEAAGRKIERLEKELLNSLKKDKAALRPSLFRALRPGQDSWHPAQSSLSPSQFIKMVRKAKEYIRRGEIFQANLSQRFGFSFEGEALDVYERLREINPSSFFGFLDAGDFQIVCGSPERLIKLEHGILETRPIAGTRSRGKTPQEDRALSLDLILSEKECAEHIMLVDLERNDMGRVAQYGSVSVDELMGLEDYSHVKHIVSNVRGVLREDLDAVDALKAFFPGGTITGAPKVRCMQIIDELDPVARGPYTGSLGYLSFTGNMDMNIIIRSLVLKDGNAYLQVGAGIVADSVPKKEYEETLYKAQGVFAALFGGEKAQDFFARRGLVSGLS